MSREFKIMEKLANWQYIGDGYRLLSYIDPHLFHNLSKPEFVELQHHLFNHTDYTNTVEIGGGGNPLRSSLLLESTNITSVDPAYCYYGYRFNRDFTDIPFPASIFGGNLYRRILKDLCRKTYNNLDLPRDINPHDITKITGYRDDKYFRLHLLPYDATEWLKEQAIESVGNAVVCNIFPSAKEWATLLTIMRRGGILITTGYGRVLNSAYYSQPYNPRISQGGGADVSSTPLPANGSPGLLGLVEIANVGDIYFYKKIETVDPAHIQEALVKYA